MHALYTVRIYRENKDGSNQLYRTFQVFDEFPSIHCRIEDKIDIDNFSFTIDLSFSGTYDLGSWLMNKYPSINNIDLKLIEK